MGYIAIVQLLKTKPSFYLKPIHTIIEDSTIMYNKARCLYMCNPQRLSHFIYLLFFLIISFFSFSKTAFSAEILELGTQVEIVDDVGLRFQTLRYDGENYDVTLKLNTDLSWELIQNNTVAQGTELFHLRNASATVSESDVVKLKNIFFQNQVYNARIRINLDRTWTPFYVDFTETSDISAPVDFSYEMSKEVKTTIKVVSTDTPTPPQTDIKIYLPSYLPVSFVSDSNELVLADPSQDKLIITGKTDDKGVFTKNIRVPGHAQALRISANEQLSLISIDNNTIQAQIDIGNINNNLTEDQDNDGVSDNGDDYPNDPQRAYKQTTQGTLAYEDLWPSEGDYDMNDLVLAYDIQEILDANYKVKQINAEYVIKARGAGYENGFAVALGQLSANTMHTATISRNGNEALPLNVEANQTGLVFNLLTNAHTETEVTNDACEFFNTEPECKPYSDGGNFHMEVVFDQAQDPEVIGTAPYNAFIYRTDERGIEIHLPNYPPTDLANPELFATEDDDSSEEKQRYYKTKRSLPWALNIPGTWVYPDEWMDITQLYLQFFPWVESNGTEFTDWYLYPITKEDNPHLTELEAWLQTLPGFESMQISSNGGIGHVIINGKTYQGRLNTEIQTGEAPKDGQLHVNPIPDQNGDHLADYEIVYANGDRQIAYFLGTNGQAPIPPDPATIAPPIDLTEATLFHKATEFLYKGDNAIQHHVVLEQMDEKRLGVLRGKVTDNNNAPLAGVQISIHQHEEFGHTQTRTDGVFDIAVNAGATLVVQYEKAGYLPVQRQIQSFWNEYTWLDDVVMIQLSPKVTRIDLNNTEATIQVAQGEWVEDEHGARRATLLFPQGLSAEMELKDGSRQALNQLDVRATEYTVGAIGRAAMPAELPPLTAYTYAVELSVDQAQFAGAKHVHFSQEVPLYVDNFLDIPVGTSVPVGIYQSDITYWEAKPDGVIIEILDIVDGKAIISLELSRSAASQETLIAENISDAELSQLVELYSIGDTLTRVTLNSFSTIDLNFGLTSDNESVRHPFSPIENSLPPTDCSDTKSGSIIECQTQVLGEKIDVTGTPYSLNYRSRRVPDNKMDRSIFVQLSETILEPSKKPLEVVINVNIAGQYFEKNIKLGQFTQNLTSPALAGQFTYYELTPEEQADILKQTVVWNGKDALGRTLQGAQKARISITYVYAASYTGNPRPPSGSGSVVNKTFNNRQPLNENMTPLSGFTILGKGRARIYQSTPSQTVLVGNIWDARGQGLGGWTLNAHHSYTPPAQRLLKGNGKEQGEAPVLGGSIDSIFVSGNSYPERLGERITVANDGAVYYTLTSGRQINRLNTDGSITHIAGDNYRNEWGGGDGGLATEASFANITDIALDNQGNLYVLDGTLEHTSTLGLLRRISPDGRIQRLAGGGTETYNDSQGSDSPTQLQLAQLSTLTIAPDNSIYMADRHYGRSSYRRILRYSPDGKLTTAYYRPHTPNEHRNGYRILDIAVNSQGEIYIAWRGYFGSVNSYIEKITTTGEKERKRVWGISNYARGAKRLVIDKTDTVYFSTTEDRNIHRLDENDNSIHIVGDGFSYTPGAGDKGAAIAAKFLDIHDFDIAPNGNIYILDTNRIRMVGPTMPDVTLQDIELPSKDGSLIYHFTAAGKHQRTVDALTGKTLLSFAYDDNGYLSSITDLDNDTTTIERDANSLPISITSADGQRTTLGLNAQGWLENISNPANEAWNMAYTEGGLLTEFTNPRQHSSIFEYDAEGRLRYDQNAAGGSWTLTENDPSITSEEATISSEMGRTTRYLTEILDEGNRIRRTTTNPDGTQSQSVQGKDGNSTQTSSDGTQITSRQTPDPRFGMLSPLSAVNIRLPSGLSQQLSTERQTVLNDAGDLSAPVTDTVTISVNGRKTQTHYDANTRTETKTTPAGRVVVDTLDENGRVIKTHIPNSTLASSHYHYDERGRLIRTEQTDGTQTRTEHINYDDAGWVQDITDAEQQTVQFDYDVVGRVTEQTLPDQRQVGYQYDANGNLSHLTPPNRPTHEFTYDAIDKNDSYVPPVVADIAEPQTQYQYNLDKQLTQVQRPDGQQIIFNYADESEKLLSLNLPTGTQSYQYYPLEVDPSSGQTPAALQSITTPSGERLSYRYDGSLGIGETWSGTVNAALNLVYNNDFRVEAMQYQLGELNPSVAYQYDLDGLLTQAGELSLTRDPLTGLLTSTQFNFDNAQFNTAQSYNTFSELKTENAQWADENLYIANYQRDQLGRITSLNRTIAGENHVYEYRYDAAGRLVEVKQDGQISHSYGFDAAGRRDQATTPQGTVEQIEYDNQDRLLHYGDNSYHYTKNGELQSKTNPEGTTQYQYDVLGNLTHVTLPNGTQLDYIVDGRNRRIGKKVNGTLSQSFIYQGSLNPVAEFDGQGNPVSLFIYASKGHVPDYIVKVGKRYRVISDHLGSVRLVVDMSDGTIVQRMDYDVFGNVILDTNPQFQPFGFAGGLYDADTGLVRFGARDYDALIGRWTAKDPIRFAGGDSNLYGYVFWDPVNFIDPLGLMKLPTNPDGLPSDWTNDPSHRDPNGSRWRHPNGDILDFHDGRPGERPGQDGWREKDHWHHNKDKKHLDPGDEIPDPEPLPDSDDGANNSENSTGLTPGEKVGLGFSFGLGVTCALFPQVCLPSLGMCALALRNAR